MIQNYINHICFVIDSSLSMSGLSKEVVKIFNSQIDNLSKRSKETGQETRVSVYFFNEKVTPVVYDMDVLRTPDIKNFYHASGSTALIDATLLAITDLQKTATLYGDHSFLVYVITDGGSNSDKNSSSDLSRLINSLPDNYTLAAFVPDSVSFHEAKKFGFPAQNISIWDTSASNLSEINTIITKSTDSFFTARSNGVRGTKNLFSLNPDNISKTQINKSLTQLDPSKYYLLIVRKDGVAIKDFVESYNIPYCQGMAYYQLSKTEIIQPSKNIAIQEKLTGKIYFGNKARSLLGLPSYEIKVKPDTNTLYNIYVQSTSVNRKLYKNTNLLVIL